MIIPIKCMTCGEILADKWRYFQRSFFEITVLIILINLLIGSFISFFLVFSIFLINEILNLFSSTICVLGKICMNS